MGMLLLVRVLQTAEERTGVHSAETMGGMIMLKVLIACEESQRVCIEFRKLGHEAYSADIQEPSGGHPEWHIHCDVLNVLNGGGVQHHERRIPQR